MMNKEESKIWREGYRIGFQAAIKDNDSALRIGQSILDALDNRYEFKEEDY